jgi:hypothetical protein
MITAAGIVSTAAIKQVTSLIAMARPNEFIARFALTKSDVYPTIVVNEHRTTAAPERRTADRMAS